MTPSKPSSLWFFRALAARIFGLLAPKPGRFSNKGKGVPFEPTQAYRYQLVSIQLKGGSLESQPKLAGTNSEKKGERAAHFAGKVLALGASAAAAGVSGVAQLEHGLAACADWRGGVVLGGGCVSS